MPDPKKKPKIKDDKLRKEYEKFLIKKEENKNPVKKMYNEMKDSQAEDPNWFSRTAREVITSPVAVASYLHDKLNTQDTKKLKSNAYIQNENIDGAKSALNAASLVLPWKYDKGIKANPLHNVSGLTNFFIGQGIEDKLTNEIKPHALGGELNNNMKRKAFGGPIDPPIKLKETANGDTRAVQRPIKHIQKVDTSEYKDNGSLPPGTYQKVYYTDPRQAKIENQDYEYITTDGFNDLQRMTNYRLYSENLDRQRAMSQQTNVNPMANTQFAMGGQLGTAQNNLTSINEGGSHESHPTGGIPMGQGNSVEQGETKKGNFIYSDRITLTDNVVNEFNLPKSLANKTAAEASAILNKKFDGRNDKISMSTKTNMLDKIAQAQESIKAKQVALEQAKQANSTQVPDMMNGAIPAGFEQPMANGGMMIDPMQMGMGALPQLATGDVKGAGIGALKTGATMGLNALVPGLGAAANPLIDMGVGLIDSIGAADRNAKIEGNLNVGNLNRMTSDFAYGGTFPRPPLPTDIETPYVEPVYDGLVSNLDLTERNGYSNPEIAPSSNSMYPKANLSQVGDILGQAARYAPIAANALQLANLKKPGYQALNKLDARYKSEYVDERSLQNITDNEMNNTVGALTQMGGSEGATRANILAAGLNKSKALGQAYMSAAEQNRATNDKGQQFNSHIDRTNLQQSNLEMDINDRNSANYRNQKSKLISGIAEGIGAVGTEETYKKLAKETFGYKWNGKYYVKPDGTTVTPEEFKAEADSAGTGQKRLGGYLLNKKK